MANLTKPRDTVMRGRTLYHMPVAAATRIFQGAIVAINASGYAVPGSTSAAITAWGVATDTVDNREGAAGDVLVPIERTVARFNNSTDADAITIADIGKDCYIVDDQTVAKTHNTNTRSVAGKIDGVDSQGVWVDFT